MAAAAKVTPINNVTTLTDEQLFALPQDGINDLPFELQKKWFLHRNALLEAENKARKSGVAGKPSLKVSEKGGVSVYGLGRFPVTLYKEQWHKLLDMADEVRDFIQVHEKELATPEQKEQRQAERREAERQAKLAAQSK